MSPEVFVAIAAAAALLGYVAGIHTARCTPENPCPKCAFHVNEGRMKSYEADRKRQEEVAAHNERRHNAEHKGFGWAAGAPDAYNCHDESCPRNVKGRGTYV